MTRIWLSQLENGQIEVVRSGMLDHIQIERDTLATYLELPDVQERNAGYQSTLSRLDRFLMDHEHAAQSTGPYDSPGAASSSGVP